MEEPANNGAKGNFPMHGHAYHLRLALVLLLQAFNLRKMKAIADFKIKMEDKEAGKFDDVVFRYSLPSTARDFASLYIQAKHKRPMNGIKQTLSQEAFLAKWNSKAQFSIVKYFVSCCERAMQRSDTYILCTNVNINEQVKKYFVTHVPNPDDMLSFCNLIGAQCYTLNGNFAALFASLRNGSLEKLGQMMADYVKKSTPVTASDPIFKMYVDLLHKCVEPKAAGTFKFSQDFITATESSPFVPIRNSFEDMAKRDGKVNWQEVEIKIDDSFFESVSHEGSYYASIDAAIEQFCRQFMLVCGSINQTELLQSIMHLMPKWVSNREAMYNNLHNMLFGGLVVSEEKSFHDLKQHFIEKNINANFAKVQKFTKQHVQLLRDKYHYINVEPDSLTDTEFDEFITGATYVYRYRCTTNMKLNSFIVAHTLRMHQYQCLYVDIASLKFKTDIFDFLCVLMEFIVAVDLATEYIITILGQLESDILRQIKKHAKSLALKIVVIEAPAQQDVSEDRLFVRDLIVESTKQLFRQHNNLKLYETTVALDEIVNGDDSLGLLFNVLDKCCESKTMERENLNRKNFDKIRPWFIPRSCVPCKGKSLPSEQLLAEQELTDSLLRSTLSLSNAEATYHHALKYEDNVKVDIFMDESGYGKSTYFTWLAFALSNHDSSFYVFRMNALQYSADFRELQAQDPSTFDDTKVIKVLYRLLHLTLFLTNNSSASVKQTNRERQKADRFAQCLMVSGGKIIVDKTMFATFEMSLDELLQLRLFQYKFNQNQIVCLLDGFDEIAPHYKDFVKKYFAKLTNLEGIRKMYISTRPYNFRDELKQMFSNCNMWRLEPFSQNDRIRFLINYLVHAPEGFKISNEELSIKFVRTMYTRTIASIQELKIIPLFLHMAVKISLSKMTNVHNVTQQELSAKHLEDTKLDQLQVISVFVEEKLKILNHEKAGTTHSASDYPVQRMKTDEANKLIEKRHQLLALFVIFPKKDFTKMLSYEDQQQAREVLQDVAKGNEKTGIIHDIRDGIPRFTHRIFAEYFAACWLCEKKSTINDESFFRSWSYWSTELFRVRDFLNRMIARDSEQSDIHMAVINQSEQQVRDILLQHPSAAFAKDPVGRLPLHLAVIYPSRAIEDFLTSKVAPQLINMKDDLFQWAPLDYAFAMRCDNSIKSLLAAGAAVNEDILLQQILSNNLKQLLINAHDYGVWLQTHEGSTTNARKLHFHLVQSLINERQLDVFSIQKELESSTVVEFCAKRNMIGIFKQLVSQMNIRAKILQEQSKNLVQLASQHNAQDVVAYLKEQCNVPLLQTNDCVELISAIKSSIKKNQMNPFKVIFQQLCLQLNILLVEDAEIAEEMYTSDDETLPEWDKDKVPKVCCVRNSDNVLLSLPEYDKKDILHEGYLIEALLATAVHEGNMQILKYIVQKTNKTITNNLIVMIMRLLPKEDDVCHEKSIPAFTYLLDKTTDRDSIDDEGRNLLHMTAQNGCFFMLLCLIGKGFDPAIVNKKNEWNVFHYVAFNQDEDRTDKILDFLLKRGTMNWFDHLDRLIESNASETSEDNSIDTVSDQIPHNLNDISKQELTLLAMFAIFKKEDLANLMSDQEFREAMQCMRDITQGRKKSNIITGIKGFSPQFTYQIFAEYFAASWIHHNKHRMKSESFFRSWTYWNGRVQRTRNFLNRVIALNTCDSEQSDIHMAVINQSVQQVRDKLLKHPSTAFTKDAVGRLPLHLAVIYPSRAIEDFLTSKMPLKSINMKDDLLQWTPLEYAFAMRYDNSVKNLLAAGAAVYEDTLLEQLLSNGLKDLLKNVHDYGRWLDSNDSSKKIAIQLHKRVVKHLMDEKQPEVFAASNELESLSILEFCTIHNMDKLFKQLVSQTSIRWMMSLEQCNHLRKIALENKSHDIFTYLMGTFNDNSNNTQALYDISEQNT